MNKLTLTLLVVQGWMALIILSCAVLKHRFGVSTTVLTLVAYTAFSVSLIAGLAGIVASCTQ